MLLLTTMHYSFLSLIDNKLPKTWKTMWYLVKKKTFPCIKEFLLIRYHYIFIKKIILKELNIKIVKNLIF